MDENINGEDIKQNQEEINPVNEQSEKAQQVDDSIDNNFNKEEKILNNSTGVRTVSDYSNGKLMNTQVSNIERQLLINNNNCPAPMSNWIKVLFTAMAVGIPGIGQIIGLIAGLLFIANDFNTDTRSFGAALLTVSVIAFIITVCFWFAFALIFGPKLY
jgi:hypothetical protein